MTPPVRISYVMMALMWLLIGWLQLAPMVITALFGYFALRRFSLGRSKVLAVAIYLIAITTIGYALVHFTRQAYVALPKIAETAIPAVVNYTEGLGLELPFTDYASLKALALNEVSERFANIGSYGRDATVMLVQLLVGLVVALSLFINAKWEVEGDPGDPHAVKDSLYSTVVRELIVRFRTFYQSFTLVIGAQIVISTINTAITSVFLLWNGYPYAVVIIFLTFLCGLLPIVGNLISNTLIIGVGFTISPQIALFALIYLVTIHKLEYFLNSKIIGDRIRNPMWLILIGLVLGEKLMGIPGMILAPVVLYYIKVEASRNRLESPIAPVPKTEAAGQEHADLLESDRLR